MAATQATAVVKAAPTQKPTTVLLGEFKGKATINVCPEDNAFSGLSAGLPKWMRVFGNDKDGDNVLFEIFKALYVQADDAGKAQLMTAVAELYEKVAASEVK